jgi:hypothetical protein
LVATQDLRLSGAAASPFGYLHGKVTGMNNAIGELKWGNMKNFREAFTEILGKYWPPS